MSQFWIGVLVGVVGAYGLLAAFLAFAWWADGPLHAHMSRRGDSANG